MRTVCSRRGLSENWLVRNCVREGTGLFKERFVGELAGEELSP